MEKVFFDLPVKNEEEAYEKIIKLSNNNDYTTGNILDFGYFKENYKLIVIDPTFTNVNRLFVLSFSINNNTNSRDSFSNYYVPNAKK